MKNTIVIFWGIIICLFVFLWGRRSVGPAIETKRDTLITVRIDTLNIIRPTYISSKVVDTITVVDTLISRDTLYLPVTQRVYQDSNYTAYVSGYAPSLDSVFIYNKTIYRDVTHVVTSARKRFGVGIQMGYGGGENGFFPYIGVGLSYNLILF